MDVYTKDVKTRTATCPFCGDDFSYQVRPGTQPVYCSPEHREKAHYARAKEEGKNITFRRCARCRETRPSTAFPSVTHPYCRPCHAEYARERRKINGGVDPDYTWMLQLRRYGLTPDTFAELVAAQEDRCAICGTTKPGGQGRWHVDHDHLCCGTRKSSCGQCVRGLLCSRCNIGIGNLRDDPAIIRAALDYITTYRERRSKLF